MPSATISGVVGPTGVGAICGLGIFLFLDGLVPDLFPTVEIYARTATWGVVAAIPLLVIFYVAGVLVIGIMEAAVGAAFGPVCDFRPEDAAAISVAVTKDSAASQLYMQSLQDRAVLAGGSVALVVLAGGACSEVNNLRNLKVPIVVLASH